MKTSRRRFLGNTLAASSAGIISLRSGNGFSANRNPPKSYSDVFLAPGYRPWQARFRGRALPQVDRFMGSVPRNYQGPLTLVSRIAAGANTKRAVLPLRGHKIVVGGPDNLAFCNAIRAKDYCVFDPHSLALEKIFKPHNDNFLGGGHCLFSNDQKTFVSSEIRQPAAAEVAPDKQYGAVVVRDASTCKVLAAYSCQGIAPHDLAFLEDGQLLAIANYGSTNWHKRGRGDAPNAVEPSVTVIELASGKLVHKVIGTPGKYEIRHLTAMDNDRLAAIQTRLVTQRAASDLISSNEIYASDGTTARGMFFAPAPLFALSLRQGAGRPMTIEPAHLSRQGQSILYDPTYKQLLVTYTSAHAIAVFDTVKNTLIKLIRTDRLGLNYPRGLVFLQDGKTYGVSGSYRGLYFFRRDQHSALPDMTIHENFFHHSHLTAV